MVFRGALTTKKRNIVRSWKPSFIELSGIVRREGMVPSHAIPGDAYPSRPCPPPDGDEKCKQATENGTALYSSSSGSEV